MCSPASFVLTKDHVFWSKTSDSHNDIVKEHKLWDGGAHRQTLLFVEITPANYRWEIPLERWDFYIDSDILPGWYDWEVDEARARKALKEWAACKLVRSGESRNVGFGQMVLAVLDGGVVRSLHEGGIILKVCSGGIVSYVNGGNVHCVSSGGMVQLAQYGARIDNVRDRGIVEAVYTGACVVYTSQTFKTTIYGETSIVFHNPRTNEIRPPSVYRGSRKARTIASYKYGKKSKE